MRASALGLRWSFPNNYTLSKHLVRLITGYELCNAYTWLLKAAHVKALLLRLTKSSCGCRRGLWHSNVMM